MVVVPNKYISKNHCNIYQISKLAMLNIIRTDSNNQDFISLVSELDTELAIRDGEDHAFYHQFNKIDALQHVVVAYFNNQAVGCGAIKDFNNSTQEVKRMYVRKEFRGQGIAIEILQNLENWAFALGFKKCVLETGIHQPEAIALYLKCEYFKTSNYGQYQGVESSICFEKELSAV